MVSLTGGSDKIVELRLVLSMTLTLAATAYPAHARTAEIPTAEKVRICVNAGTYTSNFVLVRALAITSRMFLTAGVAIDWRLSVKPCDGLQPTRVVILDFAGNTPPTNIQVPWALPNPTKACTLSCCLTVSKKAPREADIFPLCWLMS